MAEVVGKGAKIGVSGVGDNNGVPSGRNSDGVGIVLFKKSVGGSNVDQAYQFGFAGFLEKVDRRVVVGFVKRFYCWSDFCCPVEVFLGDRVIFIDPKNFFKDSDGRLCLALLQEGFAKTIEAVDVVWTVGENFLINFLGSFPVRNQSGINGGSDIIDRH